MGYTICVKECKNPCWRHESKFPASKVNPHWQSYTNECIKNTDGYRKNKIFIVTESEAIR